MYLYIYNTYMHIYVHLYAVPLVKWLSNLGNSSAKTWSDGPLIPNGSELAMFTLPRVAKITDIILKLVISPYTLW